MWFVGAGPGAPDLITLRGANAVAAADVVVYAGSLVPVEILQHAREGAELVDSAHLPLEAVREIFARALADDLVVARVHTGDPSIYGAVQEQREICDEIGLPYETVPGVSAFSAVAAAVEREITAPEISQSMVLTRLEGGRTPMPPGETVRSFAAHGTTMALYLSAARSHKLQLELLAGGYDPATPCVVAYAVTWPDERIMHCELRDLAATVKANKLWKHTLVLVGPALGVSGARSHLYHPGFFTEYRRADPQARRVLLAEGAQPDVVAPAPVVPGSVVPSGTSQASPGAPAPDAADAPAAAAGTADPVTP